ncbi:N-acetylneuraminate synthase [bacterium]|nr:N-acetylneuraminate synthase [bacterium]
MKRTFIIAEAGVNHNGSFELAKQLVDKASEAGCDCIKFQTFKAENLVNKSAKKADYQIKNTNNDDSQYKMLKNLELSYDKFSQLKEYCELKNIMFLSTPFDLESADFLNNLGMTIFKIPSGEITNLPYLRKINSFGKKVILSTGMANLDEINDALNVLKNCDVSLLHCTTEYPCPYDNVNMNAMLTIKNKFNLPVGYSDHTQGIEIPVMAVAMGAKIIEKHFTLNKTMEGPDHKASLEPNELKQMVKSIRNIELAFGNGIKKPQENEKKNIEIVRKSIVAKCDIKKGEKFTEENLTVKRPANGISPMRWDEIIGKTALKNYSSDEIIVIP